MTYSANHVIATTTGADGIIFANPSSPATSNLLIGGQNNNNINEITQGGANVTGVNTAGGSFHLSQNNANGNGLVFSIWNGPGGSNGVVVSTNTISGATVGGSPTAYTVTATGGGSTDVRSLILDPHNNTWYYGTAPDDFGTQGDFGTAVVNTATHTVTLTPIVKGTAFAHGVIFDPFGNTIITGQGNEIQQYNEAGTLISTEVVGASGIELDQGSVTGTGELFWTEANNGNIFFDDYDNTGHVGTPDFSNTQFLATNLDDITPTPGALTTVPEPSSMMLLGLGGGLIGLWLKKRHTS